MDDLTVDRGKPKKRSYKPRRKNISTQQREDFELDRTELIMAASENFTRGLRVSDNVAALRAAFPAHHTDRGDVHRYLRIAATNRWIQVCPPERLQWIAMLRQRFRWLRETKVIHTTTSLDVAEATATTLLGLVKEVRRKTNKSTIFVGFSGGHAMRAVAMQFARLLDRIYEPSSALPEKLIIGALAAGFDRFDPTTDPNSFCAYFTRDALNGMQVEFRGLAAPSIVKSTLFHEMRDFEDIAEAFREVDELDIIVASGTCWLDPHSALRRLMNRSESTIRDLENARCVADLLWRPLGETAPIEVSTEHRAFTLVDLGDLPKLIKQGKRVLVSLAPCGLCHAPKGRLLKCLLGQSVPLMTDLVVDTRTVAQWLKLTEAPRGQ